MKTLKEMTNNKEDINITVKCDKDIADNYKKVTFNDFDDVTDGYHTFKELYCMDNKITEKIDIIIM